MELPIACNLTEAEMRERRKTMLDFVRGATLNVTSLPLGYVYRFEPTSEVLVHLSRLVDLERQCCQFLTFRIVVEAGNQPICLEVTGLPEAKAIIADFFGSWRPPKVSAPANDPCIRDKVKKARGFN